MKFTEGQNRTQLVLLAIGIPTILDALIDGKGKGRTVGVTVDGLYICYTRDPKIH